jgi:hypothetical protein
MFRNIFGLEKAEGGLNEQFVLMNNKELRNTYKSHSFVKVVKAMRLQWIEHLARIWR